MKRFGPGTDPKQKELLLIQIKVNIKKRAFNQIGVVFLPKIKVTIKPKKIPTHFEQASCLPKFSRFSRWEVFLSISRYLLKTKFQSAQSLQKTSGLVTPSPFAPLFVALDSSVARGL